MEVRCEWQSHPSQPEGPDRIRVEWQLVEVWLSAVHPGVVF